MIFELLRQKWCRIIMSFRKIPFLDPKRAKLNQNSDFGHVRTYSWLHKFRSTKWKIYGTYLGNMYGIYKEYIRNIHKYLWYKIIRSTEHRPNGAAAKRPPHWGRRRRRRLCVLCFWLFYIIDIYGYSLYSPYIFPIYFLYSFHVFSLGVA